jgi:hypothetical protein
MTIFGPDISSYEHGLRIAGLSDPFLFAKVTEGTYYRDADWPAFRDATRRAGKLLVGYHFVTGEDPRAQAANLASWIGDKAIPVMLDFEPTGNSRPTHTQQLAVADAVKAAGMRVRLSYTPRWYWQQLGSPDLTGLTARGIGVVSSAYPNPSIPDPARDYAADGGDNGPGWAPYGGITPLLWQFTDAGVEQQRMDFNAFRGSVADLAAFLGSTAPTPTPGGSTMPAVPPSIGQKWPEIAGEFVGQYDDSTAIIWADGGARAAALYARQARDAVNALAGRVGSPNVDVQGLANALSPLLHPNVDVNALAAALAPHVGAPDPAAFAAELVQHITVSSK